MKDTVTAERNGLRRTFTRQTWNTVGSDKYGWVEVDVTPPPVPKEVEPALTRETAKPATNQPKRRRK